MQLDGHARAGTNSLIIFQPNAFTSIIIIFLHRGTKIVLVAQGTNPWMCWTHIDKFCPTSYVFMAKLLFSLAPFCLQMQPHLHYGFDQPCSVPAWGQGGTVLLKTISAAVFAHPCLPSGALLTHWALGTLFVPPVFCQHHTVCFSLLYILAVTRGILSRICIPMA